MKKLIIMTTVFGAITLGTWVPCQAAPGWIPHQGRLVLDGTNYHGTGYFKMVLVDQGRNVNVQAQATPVVLTGRVLSIRIDNSGNNYLSAPGVRITDTRGSGATAQAFVTNGRVTDIQVLTTGAGYTSLARVTVEPPTGPIQYTTLWSHDGSSTSGGEPGTSVPLEIQNGLYFAALGDTSQSGMTEPITPAIFADHDEVRLRLWFSPDNTPGSFEQLQPDQPLGSVGHALTASQAASVALGAITSDQLADGAVTAEKISAPGSEQIAVSDGRGGVKWMRVADFLLSQSYTPPLPGIVENEATIEIEGVFVGDVEMVNGPGMAIERIPSNPTESGLNTEFAWVFDYNGANTNDLKTWFDDLQAATASPRSGSIIVDRSDGSESFRWNFFEYALTDIGVGQGRAGKNRYTMTHTLNPNRILGIDMIGSWPQQIDDNQGVDNLVEITGVLFDRYPVVEDNPANKTLTMTFDFNEGGDVWEWVRAFATGGTAVESRSSLSVIFQNNNGIEIGRNNYYECFPIEYQHFTGFGQDTKCKARIVISYDFSENAQGVNLPLYVPPIIQYFPGTNNVEVPYDADNNRVVLEIEGVMAADSFTPPQDLPVILSGPGFEIERIKQFSGNGIPDDQSGLNREFPIILEVGSPFLSSFQGWRNDYFESLPRDESVERKSGSMIILNGANNENFRWNLFEMIPFAVEAQPSGRSRVTIYHSAQPDHIVWVLPSPNIWGDGLQNNPATDTQVEIAGITTVFAEVEVNSADRKMTLVYDFGEGGSIYDWARDVAENGTTMTGKNDITVSFSSPTNFFGCFPISIQYLRGFEQDIKGKQRVILSYDQARPVAP